MSAAGLRQRFIYRGMRAGAGVTTGEIEAADAIAARKDLRQQGVVVLDLKPKSGRLAAQAGKQSASAPLRNGAAAPVAKPRSAASRPATRAASPATATEKTFLGASPGKSGAWRRARAEVFAELSLLLEAGMGLDAALKTVALVPTRETDRAALAQLATDVREGASLAEAMRRQPERFGEQHVGLAQAGQDSGRLPAVLRQLNQQEERSERLRETLVSSLTYPAILFFVLLLSVGAIVSFVIPRFTTIFEELDIQMPLFSRIVIGASQFAADWGALGLAVALAGLIYLRVQWGRPESRRAIERWLLTRKLIGPMWWKHQAAVFAGAMSMMLRSGLPILRALEIGRSTLSSQELKARLDQAMADMREGARLNDAVRSVSLLPERADTLVAVGEEAGNLPEVLDRMADAYETEVSSRLKRALTLVEPVAIVTLGLLAGAVVIAILLAIFSINDLQAV